MLPKTANMASTTPAVKQKGMTTLIFCFLVLAVKLRAVINILILQQY